MGFRSPHGSVMLRTWMEEVQRYAAPDVLLEEYLRVRNQTEFLARPLSAEDQTIQSMADASPTKWHRAHTSWFFETFVLIPHFRGYQRFDAAYEALFNSYYNSVGDQFPRPMRGLISRPLADDIRRYREHVDEAMRRFLPNAAGAERDLIRLGLHHEQQHQELLLTDIKHAFSQSPLFPSYVQQNETAALTASLGRTSRGGARLKNVEPNGRGTSGVGASGVGTSGVGTSGVGTSGVELDMEYIRLEGGRVRVGHVDEGFCYDNETPAHDVLLDDFELAARPLTNAHVFEFIIAGGYHNPLLWLADGWSWRVANRREMPAYWRRHTELEDGASLMEVAQAYSHFTLHGQQPLVLGETACHLSYFEADALARYFGGRLPTEQEWEHAARWELALGGDPPETIRFDRGHLRPGLAPTGERGRFRQLFGSIWQWTQSAYAAYPGYRPAPGAVGEYNGKFMHNQMVLRGGSCLSPTGHLRVSYRNFFPSSTTFQLSGIRIARGVNS